MISRQAAIIALSHNKIGDDVVDVIIQHDIETIKALSAAQPKKQYLTGEQKEFSRL